eukprot:jgi/Ulvmu1/9632/UM054_0064.1
MHAAHEAMQSQRSGQEVRASSVLTLSEAAGYSRPRDVHVGHACAAASAMRCLWRMLGAGWGELQRVAHARQPHATRSAGAQHACCAAAGGLMLVIHAQRVAVTLVAARCSG